MGPPLFASPSSSWATTSSWTVSSDSVAPTLSVSIPDQAAPSSPPPPPPPPPTSTFVAQAAVTSASSSAAEAPAAAVATSASSSGTSSDTITQYLTAHNTVRAQHGASDLTWSDELASAAQSYSAKCVFQHSGGTLGPFGENLAAGTGDSYDIAAAVKSWTDEVSQYDPNNPTASHFTQVVWKATTQVGCAETDCDGIFAASFGVPHFHVCEYLVQGNVVGSFPYALLSSSSLLR
ncbi:PR-1-like protein [Stereum hirsutum FP-91666 SS1]|uniref:PR-1-like protein n=1 Tax=Stereum hirsutum (strain FP-91666) TaxID=721885 RepID=UPI000440F5BF|nr:PR-1-like protein [Stereum hirsutum FP-91666 SS1]EIM92857.1 PR-1-like protein [Stereum hirsutum FP-91666 SS1]